MTDRARYLWTEAEAWRRLRPPARNRFGGGHGVKRGIALNGGQFAAVKAQEIAGRRALREERSYPLLVAPNWAPKIKHALAFVLHACIVRSAAPLRKGIRFLRARLPHGQQLVIGRGHGEDVAKGRMHDR